MIPKVIHYCWFGGRPLPDDVKAYIDTWKRWMPDFEIKQWDETNFDINKYLYTRQAYFAKKYAFVSDVARLYALTAEGGLYFDTDIIVKKRFPDEWFELEAFGSFEHDCYVQTGVMACTSGHPIFSEFLKSYFHSHFFVGFRYDITTNVARHTAIMKQAGFIMDNTFQLRNGFALFPQLYLCANDWQKGRYDNDSTYAVHDFKGGWGRDAIKNKLQFQIKMFTTILKWHTSNFLPKYKK